MPEGRLHQVIRRSGWPSVPVPVAMPTCAAASAGTSLTSPAMALFGPDRAGAHDFTFAAVTSASTSSIPGSLTTLAASRDGRRQYDARLPRAQCDRLGVKS